MSNFLTDKKVSKTNKNVSFLFSFCIVAKCAKIELTAFLQKTANVCWKINFSAYPYAACVHTYSLAIQNIRDIFKCGICISTLFSISEDASEVVTYEYTTRYRLKRKKKKKHLPIPRRSFGIFKNETF